MTTTFGARKDDKLALRAELDVARLAIAFIRAGLNAFNTMHAGLVIDRFAKVVENHMMDAVLNANGWGEAPSHDTVKAAQAAALGQFLIGYREEAKLHRLTLSAPYLGVLQDDVEATIRAKAQCYDPQPLPKGAEGLGKAYAMTKLTIERIEQRLAMQYALTDMLHRTGSQDGVFMSMTQEIVATLLHQKQTALMRRLAMGTLLGGEALAENKVLVKRMFESDDAVISMTQVDAAEPHYWSSSELAYLHKAIAAA